MLHNNTQPEEDAVVQLFDWEYSAIGRIGAYRASESMGKSTRLDRVERVAAAIEILDQTLPGAPLPYRGIVELYDRKGTLTVRWAKRPSRRQMKVINVAWKILGEAVVEHYLHRADRFIARSTDTDL